MQFLIEFVAPRAGAWIEAEQALVAANRELITRFEKKIQATLARVWVKADPLKNPLTRSAGS